MRARRAMYNQLFQTHNVLVTTFAETRKRTRSGDSAPCSGSSNNPSTQTPATATASPKLPVYSASDYPEVKYWTKQQWKDAENLRKDSSEVPTGGGPRGGARSAKGENVMMLYVEHADGQPVSGTIAAEIRDFARSIWRGFYLRGMAPEKWGDVDKDTKDDYLYEMEKEWAVLRYCDGHWKAKAIATSIYSQWYHTYNKKMKGVKEEDVSCDERVSKKRKTMTEATDDASSPPPHPQAERTATPTPDALEVENIVVGPSSRLEKQGPSLVSRPKARPLRNPL
jgi:hypothetical protein